MSAIVLMPTLAAPSVVEHVHKSRNALLKNVIGLRRLRLRGMKFDREQFFLAAAAQNVKRLVRFLSQPITPIGEATT